MAGKSINAAGGIVVRDGARPRIAVVQRSKDGRWVLPRGKLKRDEAPRDGARREVVEETGHRVQVYEFLGAISYTVRRQPKGVQFWRMQAQAKPSRDLMKDIAAVEWLHLAAAIRRLSFSLERLFLRQVGRQVLKLQRAGRRKPRRRKVKARVRRRPVKKARTPAQRKSAATRSRARKAAAKPRPQKSRRKSHARRKVVLRAARPLRVTKPPVSPAPAAQQISNPSASTDTRSVLQRVLGHLTP